MALATAAVVFAAGLGARTTTPAALLTPTFVQSSAELGVAESTEAWGVATQDWNGDGCDDLYVGRHATAPPRFYRNGCPGAFIDDVAKLRLDLLPRKTKDRHNPAFADYDGDGRMDLFISTGGGAGHGAGNRDQLFRQLPNGTFENVAGALGIEDQEGSGRFGTWFDYDRDGDLDLFLGHRFRASDPEANHNILWRYTSGIFTNSAVAAGVDAGESSTSGAASDLDGDGDVDLITAPGQRGSLYVNQGDGTFTRLTLGVNRIISVAPGDYDGDGDVDLFLSRGRESGGDHESVLLRNDGGGVWTDVTAAAGVGFPGCLSAVWVDVDNDGHLDLFVTRNSDGRVNRPDLLLMNNGDWTFTDQAAAAGVVGPTDGELDSGVWGDFNRDGWADLVTLVSGAASTVNVYLNQGSGNSWLTVRLADPGGLNRHGFGAKVSATGGGRTQYREVLPQTPFRAQGPDYVHFGLGAAFIVETLEVRWPDGTLQTFTGVPANTRYLATKGQGLAVRP